MTAQIPDTADYQGTRYALAGVSGRGLFDPAKHGIAVGVLSTACWRGYLCEYAVEHGELLLTALELGGAKPPAELFGAQAQLGYSARYWPIRVRQPFTGGLLFGDGFIRQLYVHMGYHPAWKYETVLELTFDDGRLESVRDRSEAMAARRAAQGSLRPTDVRDLSAWIETTFDHSYEPMW
jgi:hypothetical protein